MKHGFLSVFRSVFHPWLQFLRLRDPIAAVAALDFPHLECQFIGGFPLFSPTKEGPKCSIKPKPNPNAGARWPSLTIGAIGFSISAVPQLKSAPDFRRLFSKCLMRKNGITCAQFRLVLVVASRWCA